MGETRMIHVRETSPFMMSFVLITQKENAVIVDGGRPEDMPLLREIVGGRKVAAWILTHPHLDHISGFTDLVEKGETDLMPERVYMNFPPLAFIERYEAPEAHTLRDFLAVQDKIESRIVRVKDGDAFSVDELSFTFLQAWNPEEPISTDSVGNNASLVFRAQGPKKSVMFLGDIGPDAGDRLYERHWQELKSDYAQMAHHGHSGPGAEVYLAIAPKACFWCCRDWLYDEAPDTFSKRLYGTRMTRFWMERMGVRKHYVTMDGNHTVTL